jgi:hypothetical protein
MVPSSSLLLFLLNNAKNLQCNINWRLQYKNSTRGLGWLHFGVLQCTVECRSLLPMDSVNIQLADAHFNGRGNDMPAYPCVKDFGTWR